MQVSPNLYTDGSKDGNTVAAATVLDNLVCRSRLRDGCSIFTAELKAIQLALKYVQISRMSEFLIFSDSKSVLQSIQNMNLDHAMILDTVMTLHNLVTSAHK